MPSRPSAGPMPLIGRLSVMAIVHRASIASGDEPMGSPRRLGRVFRPAEGVFFGSAPTPCRLCGANLRLRCHEHYTRPSGEQTPLSVPHSSRARALLNLMAPELLSIPVSGEALSEPRSHWTADSNRLFCG